MAGRIVRVLDGEQRVSHGWGWLTLGLPLAVAVYLYHPPATALHPFPGDPWWQWPAIYLCLFISAIGVFLLVAPSIRSLVKSGHGRVAVGADSDNHEPESGVFSAEAELKNGLIALTLRCKVISVSANVRCEVAPPSLTSFTTRLSASAELKDGEASVIYPTDFSGELAVFADGTNRPPSIGDYQFRWVDVDGSFFMFLEPMPYGTFTVGSEPETDRAVAPPKRYGIINRSSGIANVSRPKFGPGLDVHVDNEGTLNLDDPDHQ